MGIASKTSTAGKPRRAPLHQYESAVEIIAELEEARAQYDHVVADFVRLRLDDLGPAPAPAPGVHAQPNRHDQDDESDISKEEDVDPDDRDDKSDIPKKEDVDVAGEDDETDSPVKKDD
ncbi:hypothetical protein HDU86_008398 [Geranomyces michiganensis]|nr:hypothetical protein HDU86_008398 [Geranomyces michiganensis]